MKTAEGIEIKPLYTASDIQGLDYLNSVLVRALCEGTKSHYMYAGRPWTIRQYAGFSTGLRRVMSFIEKTSRAGQGIIGSVRPCYSPWIRQ